jgi:ankyrin repeat protein
MYLICLYYWRRLPGSTVQLPHFACIEGSLDIVKFLIEEFQVDKEAKDADGWTALHFAIENGHIAIVKFFDERGYLDTEATTTIGCTLLHLASKMVSYSHDKGLFIHNITHTEKRRIFLLHHTVNRFRHL